MRILCLESGGTKLVASVADKRARLLDRRVCYRQEDQHATQTLLQLETMGRELLAGSRPDAISFGFGGIVDRWTGLPEACYHEQGWPEANALERLQRAFDREAVFIENDCNLAALAEAWMGVGCRQGTLLYLTIGTGIGGGVVTRGELLRLGRYGEMELGHCVVKSDGNPCPCGNRGCLETLCSGPGLAALAREEFDAQLDSRQVMDGLRQGAPLESAIAHRAAGLLASRLTDAVNLVAPDVIVMGGGVMESNQAYLSLVEAETRRRVFPLFGKSLSFELSRLKRDVVCQGAAVWALQRTGALERDGEIG